MNHANFIWLASLQIQSTFDNEMEKFQGAIMGALGSNIASLLKYRHAAYCMIGVTIDPEPFESYLAKNLCPFQ